MAQATNAGRTVASSINQRIEQVQNSIESFDESDAEVESDESLTNMWSVVKNLEDAAETLRQEVLEPEMEERVSPGKRLCGVSHIQSHRKVLAEDPATVIGRAANRGIDYTGFVSVNASTLASNYPGLAEIEESEYTYFR